MTYDAACIASSPVLPKAAHDQGLCNYEAEGMMVSCGRFCPVADGHLNLCMFTILMIVYLVFGAVTFTMIEIRAEHHYRLKLREYFMKFLDDFQCISRKQSRH